MNFICPEKHKTTETRGNWVVQYTEKQALQWPNHSSTTETKIVIMTVLNDQYVLYDLYVNEHFFLSIFKIKV